MEQSLFRSKHDKVFLGVCAALARYFKLDPLLIRVITVLITVISGFFPGIIAYFVMAIIIPKEGTVSSSTESAFKENLADLKETSQNLGSSFKRAFVDKPEKYAKPQTMYLRNPSCAY
jgi:phage shock protein C